MKNPTAALLMTGNEIINGDILDSNAQMLAKAFAQWGITLRVKATVSDNLDDIAEAIARLNKSFDIVLINGGLGPTSDDLTAQAMANALHQELTLNSDAKNHVEAWCKKRNINVTDSNLKQAFLPEGCQIISESPGSACAFYSHNKALIIATPGVPSELQSILNSAIEPLLVRHFTLNNHFDTEYYQLFGIGEADLQALLNEKFSNISSHYILGFRAANGKIEFKITAKTAIANPALKQQLIDELKPYIFHKGTGNLAYVLLKTCQQQQARLAFAESCTGGLLAHSISQLAGASEVLQGGIVSYSNHAKQKLLAVPESTLERFGAVSEQTAIAMLEGVIDAFDANIGASVTGIAGPGGGSAEKPVGTVWLAIGNKESFVTYGLCLPLERVAFQKRISQVIFDLLRRKLQGLEMQPDYLKRYRA